MHIFFNKFFKQSDKSDILINQNNQKSNSEEMYYIGKFTLLKL